MIISNEEKLNYIFSLEEQHCFSSLRVSFGFTGKQEKAQKSELSFFTQVHGTEVIEVSEQSQAEHIADGLFTTVTEHKIAVRTADCLPLLICDLESKLVMALHAGWRSLSAGIIHNALNKVRAQYSVDAKNLAVFMGPCLSLENFEVGPEVIQAFAEQSKKYMSPEIFNSCSKPGNKDRSFFDLKLYAFYSLLSAGVLKENITAFKTCTMGHNQLWYSYRKEAPLQEHNWSWISSV